MASQGKWTPEEHQSFLNGLARYGQNWELLAMHAVPTRTAEQIRLHAASYINSRHQEKESSSKKKIIAPKEGHWTDEEHETFLKYYKIYGKSWKKLSEMMKTRTNEQIRTHSQKYFTKLRQLRKLGYDGSYTMDGTRHLTKTFIARAKRNGYTLSNNSSDDDDGERLSSSSVASSCKGNAKKRSTSANSKGTGRRGRRPCGFYEQHVLDDEEMALYQPPKERKSYQTRSGRVVVTPTRKDEGDGILWEEEYEGEEDYHQVEAYDGATNQLRHTVSISERFHHGNLLLPPHHQANRQPIQGLEEDVDDDDYYTMEEPWLLEHINEMMDQSPGSVSANVEQQRAHGDGEEEEEEAFLPFLLPEDGGAGKQPAACKRFHNNNNEEEETVSLDAACTSHGNMMNNLLSSSCSNTSVETMATQWTNSQIIDDGGWQEEKSYAPTTTMYSPPPPLAAAAAAAGGGNGATTTTTSSLCCSNYPEQSGANTEQMMVMKWQQVTSGLEGVDELDLGEDLINFEGLL